MTHSRDQFPLAPKRYEFDLADLISEAQATETRPMQQTKLPAELPAFCNMLARGEPFVVRLRRSPSLTNTLTVPRGDSKSTLTFRVNQWYGPVSPAGALELLTLPPLVGRGRDFEVVPLSLALYMRERETNRPTDAETFKTLLVPLGRAGFEDSEADPVFKNAGLWGFYREDWCAVSFGYECESAARLAAKGYAETDAQHITADPVTEGASFWRLFGRPFVQVSVSEQSDLPTSPMSPQGDPNLLMNLVQRFASALFDKLHKAANKPENSSNPWQRKDWADELRTKLRECVTKGDPLDVAAYCAFAWHHDWPTATDDDRKEVERVNKLLEDLKAVFAKHTAPVEGPTKQAPRPTDEEECDRWQGVEYADR